MRNNQPVTQKEQQVSATANILSTTNLKGQITYVNPDFVHISGFTEHELIGHAHNMVRHPDMPAEVFKGFWQDLKAQKSWMGVVKNRCKNGDHYWVDAYATPIVEGAVITEYQSVRRKASEEYVHRAEQIYREIKQGRKHVALRKQVSMRAKLGLAVCSPFLLIVGTALIHNTATWVFLSILAAMFIALALVYSVLAPIEHAVKKARAVTDDPVARYVYTGQANEGGSILLAFKKLESENAALIGRVHDMAATLRGTAENLSSSVEQTKTGTLSQFEQTDSLASAIRQMSVAVDQVAASTEENAHTTVQSFELANAGKTNLDKNIGSVRELNTQLTQVASNISKLSERSDGIAAILNVISSIAEQTNLLALNAAIEAARAGELGRGFAVVADEVRALATRTQQATQEIHTVIASLQSEVKEAVNAMAVGETMAEQSLQIGEHTEQQFHDILRAFERIAATSEQIAQASREQSQVVVDMQGNVSGVRDEAEQNLNGVKASADVAQQTAAISQRLESMTLQFWQRQA